MRKGRVCESAPEDAAQTSLPHQTRPVTGHQVTVPSFQLKQTTFPEASRNVRNGISIISEGVSEACLSV